MNVGGIKQISGEDKIQGRPLFAPPVNFYPYIKLHMLTNFAPPLDASQAITERIRYIFLDTFFCENPVEPNEIKIDKEFATKLENEYLSEMFTWIVKGSKEYYSDYKIKVPEEFLTRTNELLSQQDSIKTYFDRNVEFTNNDKHYITKNEIFESYKAFCNGNSQRCQQRSSLFNRLEQHKVRKSSLHGYDVYRGLKIKEVDTHENSTLAGISEYAFGDKVDLTDYKALAAKYKALYEAQLAKNQNIEEIENEFEKLQK
jgi:phage/plasmid-associated DNA primase